MPLDGTSPEVEYDIVLGTAADLIERRGWCQYQFTRGEQLCLVGAIAAAMEGAPHASVMAYFQKRQRIMNAVHWNDRTGRTKEQVIAALRGS